MNSAAFISTDYWHELKALDHARATDAILGKALTGLKGGKGMVCSCW
ncbi:MAG: hypothetical protein KJ070_03980 [Verrucomicrobia bacterium]|nr:hypothetical protein [Verrucomicrobiota bacterium]